jgi:hypothetical protein
VRLDKWAIEESGVVEEEAFQGCPQISHRALKVEVEVELLTSVIHFAAEDFSGCWEAPLVTEHSRLRRRNSRSASPEPGFL